VKAFIDGICLYAVGGIGVRAGGMIDEKISIDLIARDLKKLIR
jgi:hypothetical protein